MTEESHDLKINLNVISHVYNLYMISVAFVYVAGNLTSRLSV